MYRILSIIVVCLLVIGCGNDGGHTEKANANLRAIDHQWTEYSALLTDYVADGRVGYKTMKADRVRLDKLVTDVAEADLSKITEDQKLAFYINAYNIITLRSVIDAYPVKSMKDIDGVWKKQKWTVAGMEVTLNALENDVIREDFSEPRIHFALVCAAKGCPPLTSVPYLGDILDEQLAKAGKAFVTDTKRNWVDEKNGKIGLSQIFQWYGHDFQDKYYMPDVMHNLCKEDNSAVCYIMSHFPKDRQNKILGTDFKIEYLDYDWSLNEQ